jgi:predicted acylesterase/phospholipase RssA
MDPMADRQPLATCYGGGALWGIGWGLGVARALEEAGEPLADARALGCSAGAWVAAAVALRIPTSTLATMPIVVPDLADGALVRLARAAFGWSEAPTVRTVVAIDGDATPQSIPARHHPVADLVAASSAAPGLFAPVRVAGMRLVDGMCTGSTTHADMADDADRLVVIAPMAHRDLDGGERVVARLEAELDRWRSRNPEAVVNVFTPDDEVVALVHRNGTSDMFHLDLALQVEPHGRRQAAAWIDATGAA